MKKRAFVRYSKQGKVVPGSLVITSGTHPSGPSTWKEVPADLCCDLLNSIEPLKLTMIPNNVGFLEFGMYNDGQKTGTVIIDWGDGYAPETLTIGQWSNYFNHTYATAITSPKSIKIYFVNAVDVDEIWLDTWDITGTLTAVENIGKSLQNLKPGAELYLNGLDSISAADISHSNLSYVDFDNSSYKSLIVSDAPNLQGLDGYSNNNLTALDVTNDVKLTYLNCYFSANIADVTITNCPKLNWVSFYNDSLTQESVDHILTTLDANGLINGYVELSSGSNAAPSATGLTAVTNLVSKGWSVYTN